MNGAIATVHLHTQLQQRIERERLVSQITRKIHQTVDLEEILQTIVTQVRQFLQTDRIFIYRFQPDLSGIVVVEVDNLLQSQWEMTGFLSCNNNKLILIQTQDF